MCTRSVFLPFSHPRNPSSTCILSKCIAHRRLPYICTALRSLALSRRVGIGCGMDARRTNEHVLCNEIKNNNDVDDLLLRRICSCSIQLFLFPAQSRYPTANLQGLEKVKFRREERGGPPRRKKSYRPFASRRRTPFVMFLPTSQRMKKAAHTHTLYSPGGEGH